MIVAAVAAVAVVVVDVAQLQGRLAAFCRVLRTGSRGAGGQADGRRRFHRP